MLLFFNRISRGNRFEYESKCKWFLAYVDICGDLTISIFILKAECRILKCKVLSVHRRADILKVNPTVCVVSICVVCCFAHSWIGLKYEDSCASYQSQWISSPSASLFCAASQHKENIPYGIKGLSHLFKLLMQALSHSMLLFTHTHTHTEATACTQGASTQTHMCTETTPSHLPHAPVPFYFAHSAQWMSWILSPSLLVSAIVNDFCLMSP